jgi:CHAT domain
VILNAPGFDLDAKTPQQATIELDRNGDSTVARFDLTARRGESGSRALRVTFWRDGEFLASASRKIEVLEAPVGAAMPAPKAAPKQQRAMVAIPQAATNAALRISSPEPVSLSADRRPIDLTVEMIYDDPRTFSRGSVTLASRYFPHTIQSRFEASPDLASWIEGFYREFRAEAERDDSGDTPAVAAARRDARLARLRAFGDELYRRAAPAPLKRALATLLADPSVTLRTIQVYSNNPLVPWELMRAPKPKGESKGGSTDFFGIAFALARWHEDDERAVVRPLQDQPVEEVVAVAPAYGGQQALAAPVREIEQIQALLAMRQVAGRRADFIDLIRRPPSGIVHFAGHGEVAGRTPVERRFVIRFEDGLFDVMEWRGLTVSAGRSRALFFFNACDVGQAESMAGVVDGWGPAALAKGASGYIGGLWPLRDDPAARFAVAFYQVISTRLQQGERASVADALAEARRLVYQTGDATYLAYAFYGDAQLEFVRRQ